jgi:hypothetical protein
VFRSDAERRHHSLRRRFPAGAHVSLTRNSRKGCNRDAVFFIFFKKRRSLFHFPSNPGETNMIEPSFYCGAASRRARADAPLTGVVPSDVHIAAARGTAAGCGYYVQCKKHGFPALGNYVIQCRLLSGRGLPEDRRDAIH